MKLWRRTKKQHQQDALLNELVWQPKTVLWLVLILVVVALFFWSLYRFLAPPRGVYRAEYEGRIVDKWAHYSETELGSTPSFRLLVEGGDRSRFTVSVSPDVYERAKVGMRVRREERGDVLLMADESQIISVSPTPQ